MVQKNRPLLPIISWIVILYFGIVSPPHYSEESLVEATIDDDVFGGLWQTHRHVSRRFFNDTLYGHIKQEERMRSIVGTLNATIQTMQALGLAVFLDSGTLIGWYRHNGTVIPWDVDGDVGTITEECLAKYPDQGALEKKIRKLLPPPYELEYWDCNTRPDLDRHFIGYVSDSRNGFKVDIFGYSAVDSSKDTYSWRKKGHWLQRDLDRNGTHRVVPRDAILPLQWGNFSGVTGDIIPNDPKRALQWDFGFILDPPIFPHGLALNIALSPATFIVLIILSTVSCFELGLLIKVFASLCLLGGGMRVISLILCVLSSRTRGSIVTAALRGLLLIMLLSEFSPLAPQLFGETMEALGVPTFTVNPERYCLLYKVICIDM